MTGSDNWGEQWGAGEVRQLRAALGLSKASFAEALEVHRRTTRRWEQGDTVAIDHRVITALDNLLCEALCELAPWLSPLQARQMHRREALRLLTTGAGTFCPAVDWLWSGALKRIDDRTLGHLDAVSGGFVGMYTTIPSGPLIGPASAHLEDASRLLKLSMLPQQRRQLHAVIAEIALMIGNLAHNTHRPAQASAHFQLAENHAREAADHARLAAALTAQSFLHSATPSGGRSPSREALALLEQADSLASKHAPAIAQAWTAARLAEERASAGDGRGAEETLARAERILDDAEHEALPPSCSTIDYHALLMDEGLDGFRGICYILLRRMQDATDALTKASQHTSTPRRPAVILTDLGAALTDQQEAAEASACLSKAHTVCVEQDYPMGLQRIQGVRARFPQDWSSHPAIRDLDEQLRGTALRPPRRGPAAERQPKSADTRQPPPFGLQ
jgi:transcriptional regulator with XRE-family HTH domain